PGFGPIPCRLSSSAFRRWLSRMSCCRYGSTSLHLPQVEDELDASYPGQHSIRILPSNSRGPGWSEGSTARASRRRSKTSPRADHEIFHAFHRGAAPWGRPPPARAICSCAVRYTDWISSPRQASLAAALKPATYLKTWRRGIPIQGRE